LIKSTPGPLPPRQRDPGGAGLARRKNDRHAPRAQGEPAGAQLTRLFFPQLPLDTGMISDTRRFHRVRFHRLLNISYSDLMVWETIFLDSRGAAVAQR
jgi:hypothetical protein